VAVRQFSPQEASRIHDVGKAYVADPTAREAGDSRFPHEFVVEQSIGMPSAEANGSTRVCSFFRAKKKSPTDHPSYEMGQRHLFAVALEKFRMVASSDKPPSVGELTKGQPRETIRRCLVYPFSSVP
jgi:hypothetical protein